MMYYKAVLNGTCQGQDIRNILYYREGVGISWGDNVWGGSERVAENIEQEIVPSYLGVMPDDYTLESIDVYPHNDLFQLVSQLPFTKLVENGNGTNGAAHVGLSLAMNLKFQMEPASIMNGVMPPRGGYIAVGPMPGSWVGEDGYFTSAALANPSLVSLCEALASNLEFLLPYPGSFYPIRVRYNRAIGGLVKWTSWADVSFVVPHRRATWRRSRQPE